LLFFTFALNSWSLLPILFLLTQTLIFQNSDLNAADSIAFQNILIAVSMGLLLCTIANHYWALHRVKVHNKKLEQMVGRTREGRLTVTDNWIKEHPKTNFEDNPVAQIEIKMDEPITPMVIEVVPESVRVKPPKQRSRIRLFSQSQNL
jgi:hypothetical protein